MEKILVRSIETHKTKNELYVEVKKEDFSWACTNLVKDRRALRLMFATDEREVDSMFRIYAVFSAPDIDKFVIVSTGIKEESLSFESITREVPAAHWYEREIRDMFGIIPEGHPDPRRLVFHDAFPAGSHPLRKDWSITEAELKEWGEGRAQKTSYEFMKVEGEGVYEIPVGPVHAGIIEPGHFRFSAVGETIFFLEARLFFTHKGTEKQFERVSFAEGVKLAERVSGTSSFSHSAAYCMAVERMSRTDLSEKAKAIRTILIELERLYNHIGDIGNMCAGTALQVGYMKGASIKETLMQLNKLLTGSRYLRGINVPGGVTRDILVQKDILLKILSDIEQEFRFLMELLLGSVSHVERLEKTGRLAKDIAEKLGVTGVAARASGILDDLRKNHPHYLYDDCAFDIQIEESGDVLARMMVRAKEVETSLNIIRHLLEKEHGGDLKEEMKIPVHGCALGYSESPRGAVLYWVMSDAKGRPLRVKLRSSSYCNWPAVPFAVHGNIVPDFPLCNKSFNLSYSGTDM